jgi:EmrB/QacA subfamily drug resistance transporter
MQAARIAGSGPAVRPQRAGFVLAMVVGTSLLTGVGMSIMSVAFPEIRRAFPDTTAAQLSWINNLFTIVSAATLIPCGVLADRLGRKRMLLAGVALFTAGSVIGALAPGPGWIMIGRTVQALGSSAYGPASTALLISAFPPERIGTAIGIWAVSSGVASASGPSLGGFVIDRGGWQWAFWINLPVGLLALALGPFLLRETATDRTRRLPDLLGVALVMAATSALTFGLVQRKTEPRWGWLGPNTWLSFAVGAALLTWFLRRCRRHANPLLDLGLFRAHSVRVGMIGTLAVAVSWFALSWALVQHTINVWHWSVFEAGMATAPGTLVSGISGVVTGRLAARHGHRWFILAGSAGLVACCAFYWLTLGEAPVLWSALLPGSVVAGMFAGFVFPAYIATTMHGVPAEQHSVGSAVNFMAQRSGITFGTALAITFIASNPGVQALRHSLVLALAGSAVCFGVGLLVREERPAVAHT